MSDDLGRRRVVIENVRPEVDAGRFPVKRSVGDKVVVEADVFADGNDALSSVLRYRREDESKWLETPMKQLFNDLWRGEFAVTEPGFYRYTVEAWINAFETWHRKLTKKLEAGQDISLELRVGLEHIQKTITQASAADRELLERWAEAMGQDRPLAERIDAATDDRLYEIMGWYPDRRSTTTYGRTLRVFVDRERARFSAWYEMFPRSCSPRPSEHGTFRDCEERLSYIASMGFDVLYLPPIHPIGVTHRKGKNNAPVAQPGDPGSPWAIGSEEGGHRSVHSRLGTLEDFRRLVSKVKAYGMEIALDLAFQCSPDHPYVKDHPEWFRWRPDRTIQFAENPPKTYEDIYPLDFETDQWEALWSELTDIVFFWIEQGIRIFRVDNPHTKPFAFWETLIWQVKASYPEVIFLSEAFTRPKVMNRLAKLGFTQSYTYFTWRNTKWEIIRYFQYLSHSDVRDFFRPNLWPNTPDILPEYLQIGGRPAFTSRMVLAATLSANYGIYGPAFELCENRAKALDSEEYLNAEKYEIKDWDLSHPDSLAEFISRINRIRQENPALQNDWSLRFHSIENDQLLCFSKHTEDFSNLILVVVNLDPHHIQAGWIDIPLADFKIDSTQAFQMHDLLGDARFLWYGSRNYVALDPGILPAHILRLRKKIRTERDFDYFM